MNIVVGNIIIDDKRLTDTESLDVSFIDGKSKKKKENKTQRKSPFKQGKAPESKPSIRQTTTSQKRNSKPPIQNHATPKTTQPQKKTREATLEDSPTRM